MNRMKNTTIDINENSIKRYVESLRPKDPVIREQLDLGYSYDGKIAILYEIRPFWDNPKKFNTWNLLKLDFISQDKNGIYIGCVQAENGNFTNHFQNQLI